MSKFASTAPRSRAAVRATPDTVNLAGGTAWSQDAKLELASLLVTSMVEDQYYRSANDQLVRLRELADLVDPLFAAKAAVYARNKDGLRSITHALAAELAPRTSGADWTRRFYDRVVRRPDDATEILAYYLANYGKPIPSRLKRGLGDALGKFDRYQLAKWKGGKGSLSLVDVVNLIHPKPTEKNAQALADLVADKLVSEGTWEAGLSKAGSDAQAKSEVWSTLLREGRLGYLALLRNLRNIATDPAASELVPLAVEQLTDPERVHKSLIFPFQFLIALRELGGYPVIVAALSDAVDLSLANVPDFGHALVSVDGSGSMQSPVAGNEQLSRKAVGSLFAAALFKKNFSRVQVFGSTAGDVPGLNPRDSTLTIASRIERACYGHSTNFNAIFDEAGSERFDNVIIFSDMQAWVHGGYGYSDPRQSFEAYKKRTKADPFVFAFDLAGYGSAQFPERQVFQLAGFTDNTLKIMENLKTDRHAFVREIEAVQL